MADIDDIDLPAPEDGTAGVPEVRTIKGLMEECEHTIANYQSRYLPQAIYNERMCEGEQFIDITQSWEIVDAEWPEYVPKASRNLLRNLRLTWSARILEDRPFVKAWPAEPGADEIRSDIGNRLLQWFRQRIDFDDMCFAAAQLVQVHSAVGFKIVWDPLQGPASQGFLVDGPEGATLEGAGEPEGEVSVEVVSIFDYGTDGSENVEDSKWVMFWKHIDPYDARVLLRAANLPDDKLDIVEFTDIWGIKRRGCKVVELWHKPDYRFPDGLFAVRVGDTIVQATKYPYRHGELPIAVWKCGPRRGSPYGSTHVDDAVYIQKVVNETVAAIWQQARMIGAIKLLAPPNIADQWEHGNQIIKVADPNALQYIRYLEPPNRAAILVETLEDNIEAMYTVYGLNEMLTGADNAKSGTSARAIAYLNKLDSMKISGASRSLGKAIRRIFKQFFLLCQEWVQNDRLASISGDKSGLGPMLWNGADLEGLDVILEDSTATEGYRAQASNDATQQMAQQGPTPDLQATAKTGIKDSAYTRSQEDLVGAQITQLLRGQPQQPMADADPAIAVQVITLALSSVPQGSSQQQAMLQLLQAYKQAAATQQSQQSQDDAAVQAAGGKNAPPTPTPSS